MKVEILAFCDFATKSGGKLTLVGVFDRINTPKVPTALPVFGLAIKLRLEETDLRKEPHKFVCKLTSHSGKEVVEVGGQMVTQRPAGAANDPAEMGTAEFAFTVPGVKFEEFGTYTASLSVDGQPLSTTPLFVVKVKQ